MPCRLRLFGRRRRPGSGITGAGFRPEPELDVADRRRADARPDAKRGPPVRTKLLGLHVDRLMEGLGLALDEVIDLKKVKAASVAGDDIHLQPTMKFNIDRYLDQLVTG